MYLLFVLCGNVWVECLSLLTCVLIVCTDGSSSGSSPPNLMDALTDQQGAPVSPEVMEKNKKCLAAMDNLQVKVFLCCWKCGCKLNVIVCPGSVGGCWWLCYLPLELGVDIP